jgi:MFS family permease
MQVSGSTSIKKRVFWGQNLFLLLVLALGHTLMHCLQQGWYIVLPSVKETFGFSNIQYGGIDSIRSASGTAMQIPSGAASDILRKQWALIVVFSLFGIGVAYVLLGLASNYGTVLLAAILLGFSISLWHPSALSVLSVRLAERRGMAFSIHGMGGNLGNAVGPAIMGVIIGVIAWQMASWIMAMPVMALAVLLWIFLRNIPGREGGKVSGRQYIFNLISLLKNRVILGLVISGGIRAMSNGSIFVFFSLYCREDLGFGPAKAGLYFTMMMTSGIASQPLLGYLSDRFGRKIVLIPSLVLMGFFEIFLVWSGSGIGLALVAICIGLFIYALGAVTLAAAMDVAPEEAGATTIALLFGSATLFKIPSPMIAGWLSDTFGTPSVFLYSGGLVLLSALLLVFLPIDRKKTTEE